MLIFVLMSFAQAAGVPCCAPPLHTHTTAQAEVLVARLGDAAVHLLTFPHSLLQQVEGMKMKGAPLAV